MLRICRETWRRFRIVTGGLTATEIGEAEDHSDL